MGDYRVVDRDHDAWAREVSGHIAGCNELFAIEAECHYIDCRVVKTALSF